MELKPTDMIRWFRDKALEFQRIADSLESTFDAKGKPSLANTIPSIESPSNGSVTISVASVQRVLREIGKGARYTTIAEHLHADSERVKDILWDNPDTFEQSGRGWWKVKE